MPVQCKLCKKSYQKTDSLRTHLIRKHGIPEKKIPIEDEWDPPVAEDITIDENAFDELPDLEFDNKEQKEHVSPQKDDLRLVKENRSQNKKQRKKSLHLRRNYMPIVKKLFKKIAITRFAKKSKCQWFKRYKCNVCNRRFWTKYEVLLHMAFRRHPTSKKPKRNKKRSIKNKEILKPHSSKKLKKTQEKVEKKKEKESLICKSCSKTFVKLDKLVLHKLSKTEKCTEPLGCALCNFKGKSVARVRNHERKIHNICNLVFDCYLCKEGFTSLSKFEHHLKTIHELNIRETFKELYRERSESFIFMNYRPFMHGSKVCFKRIFRCPVCDHKNVSMADTESHIKEKHNDLFECKICSKVLFSNVGKKRHLALHWKSEQLSDSISGTKKRDVYECLICCHKDENFHDLVAHITYLHMFKKPKVIIENFKKKKEKRITSSCVSVWNYLLTDKVDYLLQQSDSNSTDSNSESSSTSSSLTKTSTKQTTEQPKNSSEACLPRYCVTKSKSSKSIENCQENQQDKKLLLRFEKVKHSVEFKPKHIKRKRSETETGITEGLKMKVPKSIANDTKSNDKILADKREKLSSPVKDKKRESSKITQLLNNPLSLLLIENKTSTDSSTQIPMAKSLDIEAQGNKQNNNSITENSEESAKTSSISDNCVESTKSPGNDKSNSNNKIENKENIISEEKETPDKNLESTKAIAEEADTSKEQLTSKKQKVQDMISAVRSENISQSCNSSESISINVACQSSSIVSQKTDEPATLIVKCEPTTSSSLSSMCKVCFTLVSEAEMPEHMNRHVLIVCEFCTFGTLSENALNSHVEDFHSLPVETAEPNLKCQACNFTGTREEIISHLINKCEFTLQVRCFKCKYYALSKTDLNTHYNQSHLDTKNIHRCFKCNYSSKHWVFFQMHNEIKHNQKGADDLNSDMKNFLKAFKQRLLNRIAVLPKTQTKFSCCHCDFDDTSTESIIQHSTGLHSKPFRASEKIIDLKKVEYKCLHCGNILSNLDSMLIHLRVNHNQKDFTKSSILNNFDVVDEDTGDGDVVYLMTTFENLFKPNSQIQVLQNNNSQIEVEYVPKAPVTIEEHHLKEFETEIITSLLSIGKEGAIDVANTRKTKSDVIELSDDEVSQKPNDIFIDLTLDEDSQECKV
ncbi:unnamed protein product [Dimorphilus gyrociliatus]|uniref:C2H2-type domain-containing protein n=1 Tax=Dimorphilus gyrociliatus TaxID=2664684 RepID=A0A7I8W170_9ANNE|nr:unnamed protein product [Dimorphilus gyrociliatus]